jgi:FdhD protein
VSRRIRSRPVVHVGEGGDRLTRPDEVAVEEPLELRVGGKALTVTMRTPGDDVDLAAGFLVTEGVITEAEQFQAARYCAGKAPSEDVPGAEANTYNVLDLTLRAGVTLPETTLERHFYASSSCGLCGKASIEAITTVAAWSVTDDPLRVRSSVLLSLPDRLRAGQHLFERTGGLHAAGLFTADGEMLCVREDVGRHNAVDKVVGWALREGRLPLRGMVLQVSGRTSFELTQKALMAGIPMLSAVSAPSSLAVSLAEASGMTLVGFVRGAGLNIYTGAQRVV